MFWAIAAGIASGAKIYTIAVGGSLFIGIVILLLSRKKLSFNTYLLIIKYEKIAKEEIIRLLGKQEYDLKSKVVANGYVELTLELHHVGKNTSYVDAISEVQGVQSAVIHASVMSDALQIEVRREAQSHVSYSTGNDGRSTCHRRV